MSEELCPSSADTPVPLPFFVRTANQVLPPLPSKLFLLFCLCKPSRYQVELEREQKRVQVAQDRLWADREGEPVYIQRDSGPQGKVFREISDKKVGPLHAMLTSLSRGQGNGTGEARDMYVPNPSCRDFAKYEWIGQLMGAALRGKEFLVSCLTCIPSALDPGRKKDQPNLAAQDEKTLVNICPTGPGSAWFCVEAAVW